MSTSIRFVRHVVLVAVLAAAVAARADVTLTTDKLVYAVGDTVHVTAHNNGPGDVDMVSYPYFAIFNVDTDECVYGCAGLPVVTTFPAGATVTADQATAARPDEPGTYRVSLAMFDGPIVTYLLEASVPDATSSWSTLKARYR